jgi:N-acetylneuraminic acid mutarotase
MFLGGMVWVFQGLIGDCRYDGVEVYHELYCYDTEGNTWTIPDVKGFKPPSRSNSAFASVGNKFFVYGGTGKGKVLDEFLMFDAGK